MSTQFKDFITQKMIKGFKYDEKLDKFEILNIRLTEIDRSEIVDLGKSQHYLSDEVIDSFIQETSQILIEYANNVEGKGNHYHKLKARFKDIYQITPTVEKDQPGIDKENTDIIKISDEFSEDTPFHERLKENINKDFEEYKEIKEKESARAKIWQLLAYGAAVLILIFTILYRKQTDQIVKKTVAEETAKSEQNPLADRVTNIIKYETQDSFLVTSASPLLSSGQKRELGRLSCNGILEMLDSYSNASSSDERTESKNGLREYLLHPLGNKSIILVNRDDSVEQISFEQYLNNYGTSRKKIKILGCKIFPMDGRNFAKIDSLYLRILK
eukprot:Opistho-1_new@42076